MKQPPTVSVILPSYNHAPYVMAAGTSVLRQSFRDFELLAIDDASSDGSILVLEQLRNIDPSRVQTILLQENIGGAAVLNEGIRLSRGKYIAICNSDDEWLPDKLAKQVEFLESNPNLAAVFSDVIWIDGTGQELTVPPVEDVFCQPNRPREQWLRSMLTGGNSLCHPSILIHREVYERIGLYDARYRQLPDYDMWIRICQENNIFVLQEPTIKFRYFANQSNASGVTASNSTRDANERLAIYSKLFDEVSEDNFDGIFGTIKSRQSPDFCFELEKALVLLGSFSAFRNIADQVALKILYSLSSTERFRHVLQAYGLPEKFLDLITGLRSPLNYRAGHMSLNEKIMVQAMDPWIDRSQPQAKHLVDFESADYQLELSKVLTSFSWRATRGLREVNAIVRGEARLNESEDISEFFTYDSKVLKTALNKIKQSKSWKITAPFRVIADASVRKPNQSNQGDGEDIQLAIFDDSMFELNEAFRYAELCSLSSWFPEKTLYYTAAETKAFYESFEKVHKYNSAATFPFIDGIQNPQIEFEADIAVCLSPVLCLNIKEVFERNQVPFVLGLLACDQKFMRLNQAEQKSILQRVLSSPRCAGFYTDSREHFSTGRKIVTAGQAAQLFFHNPVPSYLCAPVVQSSSTKGQSQILILNSLPDTLHHNLQFVNTLQRECGGLSRFVVIQAGREITRSTIQLEAGGIQVITCPDLQSIYENFGEPDALVVFANDANRGWMDFVANSAALRKIPVVSLECLSQDMWKLPERLFYKVNHAEEILCCLRNILRGRSHGKLQPAGLQRFQSRFNWAAAQRERQNFFSSVTSNRRHRKAIESAKSNSLVAEKHAF